MHTGFFAGRLGKDAQLKYTPQGKAVANFSIAVDDGFGDNKKTLWVDCAIWEERAEKLAPYLTKGKFVAVQGDVNARAWVNKNTGDAQCSLTVTVRQLTFGPGGEQRQENSAPPQQQQSSGSAPVTDDDIPF